MEWLFLTCHNYWIVCRLVRDDDCPYLAYSPAISIEDSSEPFRAFLGAILSVVKDVPIESSTYSPDMGLDTIEEEDDDCPSPEYDIDDGPGAYQDSSGREAATGSPTTRSHAGGGHKNTESQLIVHLFLGRYLSLGSLIHFQITASSPNSPENFQIWIHLYTMSNNTLALPLCARNDKPRLWLTCFIASGCRFDNSDESFAAKIVEVLRPSDAENRERLRNEFKLYLILDEAYQSGKLRDRIAPRYYGAFEGNGVDVLILGLCDSILNSWHELSASEL
jgi:hypothetical protein